MFDPRKIEPDFHPPKKMLLGGTGACEKILFGSFREGETVATFGGLKDDPVPLEEIEKDFTTSTATLARRR